MNPVTNCHAFQIVERAAIVDVDPISDIDSVALKCQVWGQSSATYGESQCPVELSTHVAGDHRGRDQDVNSHMKDGGVPVADHRLKQGRSPSHNVIVAGSKSPAVTRL